MNLAGTLPTMTEQLLIIVGITTLCMLSPGPDMVLVMRNTLVVNRRAGAWTALGILTGNLIHIGYCVLGLGLLLAQSPTAYKVLRYASALYLAYLGWLSLQSRGGGLDASGSSPRAELHRPYLQGLLNNLLNPKGVLFYLGVFTQVITPNTSVQHAVVLISTMVAVSAGFWLVFVQTLHLPAVRERLQHWNRAIDRSCGVLLLSIAARVALLD